MQLSTRLWLLGAVLPAVVMGALLFGVQRWFAVSLERSLDQGLLAQAAIESVSLFDGPDRRPHLHMASSPLVESVRAFAPEGVLFGPDGEEVMRYPPVPNTKPARSERHPPGQPGEPPVLSTRGHQGSRERVLTVTVRAPTGAPYTLRLMATMAQVDRAVAISQRLSLAALAISSLALLLLQTWQGRSIRRRLAELTGHIEALRAGDLERALPKENTQDELAALRDVLAEATASLRQARDSKERLLADAAHELRTPLTLMRTSLDLALRRERPVSELKSALEDTRVEVDRLAVLATRLLDTAAAAQQAEPKQTCDVTELVTRAVERITPECEMRNLSISVESAPHLTALLRPHDVRRALDNLLSNALKHAKQTISVEVKRANGYLSFTVRDDGEGIPIEERELVFEPFHRVHQGGQGVGLGLAIVREVALSHAGRAFVQPSEHGAQVVLELAVG